MAVYNEILVARYANALRKLFGMKGGNPTKQLASEIIPVMSMFYGAENRFLETWNRFSNGFSIGPVAANQSGIRLRNPSGSNVVVVIEKILVAAFVTDEYDLQLGATNTDLSTINSSVNLRIDPRGNATSTLILSQQASAVSVPNVSTGNVILGAQLSLNTSFDFIVTDIQELTLLPGDAIQITEKVVNSKLVVSFLWRERFLEDSERQ